MSNNISIIIPVYNASDALTRCLDSIKAQSYKDFECILVDDGSKDSSLSICTSYAEEDKRFKVYHKENGGASSARNLGLSYAQGDFVCFCDADDYVEPDWLEQFMDNASKVDIVICSYNKYRNNSKETVDYPYQYDDIEFAWATTESFLQAGFLWNKCFRNDIIKDHNIRFNENYTLDEDEEFISHYLMYAHSMRWGKKTTYNYMEPDWDKKYNNSNVFDCLIDIYDHTHKFCSYKGTSILAYTSIVSRLFGEVQSIYASLNFKEGLRDLKQLDKIMLSCPSGIPIITSKPYRLFLKGHPRITHIIYCVFSLLRIF